MSILKNHYFYNKTIYALSTIFGQSAISLIRISGVDALNVLKKFDIQVEVKARFAHFVQLKLDNKIVDNCILLYFQSPNSFSGEDIIELHLHGSKAVINLVLKGLSEIENFVMAEPGEFTRRAFMNRKLDLVQAEGLLAVIHSETQEQLTQANKQLSGENSRVFNSIRSEILQIFANCEAMLDFPEDDEGALQETLWVSVPEARASAVLSQIDKDNENGIINERFDPRNPANTSPRITILNKLKIIYQQIISYLDDNHIGEKIENGFKIAIVGEPNVGKSSLINYLAKKPIAIVSEIAGTTRDLVTINLNIDGYQVTLIDTAGIRETEDVVESIGVNLAKNIIKEADLILVMSTLENLDNYKNYISEIDDRKHIFVLNKMDSSKNGIFYFDDIEYISISIQSEKNLDILMHRIRKSLLNLFPSSSPVITTKRQRIILEKLRDGLMKIINNFWQYPFLDIMTEEIRNMANYVSQLTGDISTDDVLDELFINFCIGK